MDFDRIRAAFVGALAGLIAYAGWLFSSRDITDPAVWRLAGPVKWWLLVGAVLGFVLGLDWALDQLRDERDDLRWDLAVNAAFVVAVIAVIALVAITLRLL